jgi:hypothetical protein
MIAFVNNQLHSKAKGGDQMPGFNRRGPDGMGPMTGGGRGLCNPANRSFSGRGTSGTGRGRGFGNCRRLPGMGRRAGFGYTGASYDKDREEAILKNEEAMLKDELESVKQRLEGIKKTV